MEIMFITLNLFQRRDKISSRLLNNIKKVQSLYRIQNNIYLQFFCMI